MTSGGDYNMQGRFYEVLFKAECLKRNLVVLSPEHTHLQFDVAIFSRGRFMTVQVKGTQVIHVDKKDGARTARFACSGTKKGHTYRDAGVDFMALYVAPKSSWFVIPMLHVTGKTFDLRFGPNAKSSDWLERWDFLGAPLEVE